MQAPGPQTKARALFYRLKILAQRVLTPTKIVVQLVSVWEASTSTKGDRKFNDLLISLRQTKRRSSRSTPVPRPVLLISLERSPTVTAATRCWTHRLGRATELYDKSKDEWQQTLDADHQQVYTHALERITARIPNTTSITNPARMLPRTLSSKRKGSWPSAKAHIIDGPSIKVDSNVNTTVPGRKAC